MDSSMPSENAVADVFPKHSCDENKFYTVQTDLRLAEAELSNWNQDC